MKWAVAAVVFAFALGCGKRAPQRGADFQIVTETAVIRGEDPLPSSSPIFDGQRVRLQAVRGETVAISVVFSDSSVDHRVVAPSLGDRVGVTSFQVELVPVVEASSAMFGPSLGPGKYPDRLKAALGEVVSSRQVVIDFAVAADAKPGPREASIRVDGVTVPIELTILPFSIQLARAPLVWAWYRASDLGGIEDEKRHQDLFLAHGVLLATDPSADELEASRELIVSGALYWPVRIRADDPKTVASNARRVIEFFEPLGPIPFTIPIDEPANDDARARVVANGWVIAEAGGGPGRLLHTVTDFRRPIYGSSVDVFISPRNVRLGSPSPRLRWTYNGRPPEAGNMTVDSAGGSLRSWGWIAYRYQVELWYAWHALYYTDRYNGAKQPTELSKSMLTFDQRRKGGRGDYGNGDGLLVYPGLQPSLRLKALRRGLQDRLLLAKLRACGGEAEASAIAAAVVPTALAEASGIATWPDREAGWELARGAVLNAIVRRCPPE